MDLWVLVAFFFMIFAVTLSLYEVVRHLVNFTKPYLQRYIIRILLMVPIYSLNAWIAMIYPAAGLYLDASREVYESFVIYSFMKYLLNFLQFDTNLQQYIDHKPGPNHIFPLCFLPNCVSGRRFMVRCKHGILQYVVVRPVTSLVAFTSQLFNFYGEGNYNPLSGYTYPVLLIVNNISQVTAMYCLVIFYSGYRNELDPMRPLAKFFSIKLVVFFSFFQSVVIAGLLEIDFVEDTFRMLFPELDTKVELGRKAQEFLICFDMLIAGIGHLFAFDHRPFADDDERHSLATSNPDPQSRGPTCWQAFCNILDFDDEKSDFSEHFGQIFSRIGQLFTFSQPLPMITSSNELASDNDSDDHWLVYSTGGDQVRREATQGHSKGSQTRNYQSVESTTQK